jgi:hypothetical protein
MGGSLNRRTFGGKLYTRYHSYGSKADAKKTAASIRRFAKEPVSVRVVKEPNGFKDAPYTIYTRRKR